jgi:hypothetical protein
MITPTDISDTVNYNAIFYLSLPKCKGLRSICQESPEF